MTYNLMSMTHAIYARQVREHIFLRYGIKLKKASLIYGSVKPDASTLFAKYPHYIDKSLQMVCQRLTILEDSTNGIKEIETRAFARELGVALHYVADYFCKVHNDINGIKHNEGFMHVVYEQRLHNSIKLSDVEVIREEVVARIEQEMEKIDKVTLCKYIAIKNRKYIKEAGKLFFYDNASKHYMIDLKYSLEMVLLVASHVVEKTLKI